MSNRKAVQDEDEPSARSYAWSQVGALLGAAAVAGILFPLWATVVMETLFEDDGRFEVWAVGFVLGCIAGAGLGCGVTLRRRGHRAAASTACVLVALQLVLFVVVWWSSSTALQSRLYPYGFILALVSPLAARAVALRL